MNVSSSKLLLCGLLFLLTLLSGVLLSHSGKPYPTLIFNVHKLIAVGTVVVIGINVYRLYPTMSLPAFLGLAIIALTGVLFLALIVTGGLLSLNISLAGSSLKVHQVVPLLALAASALSLYLLAGAHS